MQYRGTGFNAFQSSCKKHTKPVIEETKADTSTCHWSESSAIFILLPSCVCEIHLNVIFRAPPYSSK